VVVAPVAAERYEIRFTASAETRQKLRQVQDLLRHAVPTGDVAEIFDRALSALLEDVARRKLAATKKPRAKAGTLATATRHIPATVKRQVWIRDGGRCAYVAKGRRRCGETGFLEFHHRDPFANGGPTTVENVELRCRAHNSYEAQLFFGVGERCVGIVSPAEAPAAASQLSPERVPGVKMVMMSGG
jgi:hypothetical protein